MAKQTINIGTSANDGTGSTLREAFDITNDNFTELYDGTGGLLHKIGGTNFSNSLLIGHSTTGTLSNATNNVGIGIEALQSLTSGDRNIAIGKAAGKFINNGNANIIIGDLAGDSLTSGGSNIAIGRNALSSEDTTGSNVAIGHRVLQNQNSDTTAYNVAVGYQAGIEVTTGTNNTIIGGLAGDALTTSVHSVAIGYKALTTEDTGHFSVAIGSGALEDQNYGGSAFNVAVGYEAGNSISTGIQNTIVGGAAADSLTTGSNNIVLGYNAEASAVDVSNEVTIGNSSITNVRIPSDSTLKIGASGDLQLEHVSSNSFIKNTAVGDLYIENQVDDADVIFRCDNGSGGLDTYFKLDGANSIVSIAKPFFFQDNVKVYVGNGFDLEIYHDATQSVLNNKTGHFIIQNAADDSDIAFKSDDGSGGIATYMTIDGGVEMTTFSKDSRHNDSVKARFGSGGDLYIEHDGTDSKIINTNGDLSIQNQADNKDIIFKSEDGSGGVTEYFKVDGSARDVVFNKDIHLLDNVNLRVGTGMDLNLFHNGTDSKIQNDNGDLYIINRTDDKDIIFQSDDGSGGVTEYFRVDGSAERTKFSKNILFTNNTTALFGDDGRLSISHNGTDSVIDNFAGDLYITNKADDKDIIFRSDDGSGGFTTYFKLDGSSASSGTLYTQFPDNSNITFGSADDLQIKHDGTDSKITNVNGDLYIRNTADDKDIIFQSDDGSSGLTTYFFLDGSSATTQFYKTIKLYDSAFLYIGDNNDLQFYHNGTNSTIANYTGNLFIANNTDDADISFQCDNGSGSLAEYFRLDGSSVQTIAEKDFRFIDDIKVILGTGSDLQIYHNSTSGNGIIENNTGNLVIQNNLDDSDVIFKSDNGAGSVTAYITLDGSNVRTQIDREMRFMDTIPAKFGTGGDLILRHNATDSYIENSNGDLLITNNANDKDIKFSSDDGSGGTATYFFLDGSQADGTYRYIDFPDNSVISLGDNDAAIFHDGTDTRIKNETGDLFISQFANDKDIVFRSDDGGGGITEYFKLDGTNKRTKFSEDILIADTKILRVGSGADLQISHNGTHSFITNANGDLTIANYADDRSIYFQNDDGSGGSTNYIQLDGSDVSVKILTQKVIMSNLPTSDPSVAGQLYNDSGVLKVSAG